MSFINGSDINGRRFWAVAGPLAATVAAVTWFAGKAFGGLGTVIAVAVCIAGVIVVGRFAADWILAAPPKSKGDES